MKTRMCEVSEKPSMEVKRENNSIVPFKLSIILSLSELLLNLAEYTVYSGVLTSQRVGTSLFHFLYFYMAGRVLLD